MRALAPWVAMTAAWLIVITVLGGPGGLRSGDWGVTLWSLAKYCIAGTLAAMAGRKTRFWLKQ